MIKRLVVALISIFVIGVVSAISVNMDFHVAIAGINKLHPGEDTEITLLIENEAKVTNFPLNENTSQLLKLITTAKDLRVEIDDRWIPIEVKSTNPQLIGDLPAGVVAKVKFRVKVYEKAEMGKYRIPIRLKYTKVTYSVTDYGAFITYIEDESDLEYVSIEIAKRDYDFSVKSIKSDLRTNERGLVEVIIENTGLNKICDAILYINSSPPLFPDPNAMSSYLGDLNVGEEAKATFKVYVADNALNQTYPAKLILKFKTTGKRQIVLTQTIGLSILNEGEFEILSVESLITSPKAIPIQKQIMQQTQPMQMPFISQKAEKRQSQGLQTITVIPSRGFVKIHIKVKAEMRDAVATLSFENPSIRVENSPYLRNLSEGEIKDLVFYVTSKAPPGKYRACLILKYKNELGDEEISRKHYVEVEIRSINPLKIEGVKTKNVGVGLKGDIELKLKNEGYKDVKNLKLYLISPDSSITPVSSSYFINELKPGEVRGVKFRVYVSNDAISGLHDVYVVERFDLDGVEDLVSIAEVPIPVKSKTAYFEILSVESDLHPDETGEVIVKVRNSGSLTVYNAVVKLELNPPLTIAGGSSLSSLIGQTQPGLYFIGTLNPGDIAIAKFRVDVDKDAGAGFYPVNIIVEYYDEDGYKHESSPITASVEVKEKPLITLLTATAITLAVIGLITAGKFLKRRFKHGKT